MDLEFNLQLLVRIFPPLLPRIMIVDFFLRRGWAKHGICIEYPRIGNFVTYLSAIDCWQEAPDKDFLKESFFLQSNIRDLCKLFDRKIIAQENVLQWPGKDKAISNIFSFKG